MDSGTATITLATILSDVASLVGSIGSTFTALVGSFGIFLFLPVLFRTTGKSIGYVKGLLGFGRGRSRGRG